MTMYNDQGYLPSEETDLMNFRSSFIREIRKILMLSCPLFETYKKAPVGSMMISAAKDLKGTFSGSELTFFFAIRFPSFF